MPTIEVRLLGVLDLRYQNTPIPLNGQRTQELFCYLLLHAQRSFVREVLADLLWSSDGSLNVRKTLRQAIWHLQGSFSALEAKIDTPIIVTDVNRIQFNPQVSLVTDVTSFERSYLLCKGIPGWQIDAETAGHIQHALELYRGDLLEGCYEDWCLRERERFQTMYLAMLDKLMDYYEAHHRFEHGVDCGIRILRHDHARECTHYQLIRILYRSGDRTRALRQYERCLASLHEELGVRPARATVELYEKVRRDEFIEEPPEFATHGTTPTESNHQLAQIIDRLERFEASLTSLQSQVEQEIRAVHHALELEIMS